MNPLARFFIAQPFRRTTPGTPTPRAGAPGVSVFLSKESFNSFPLMSVVITTAWRLLKEVAPAWGGSKLVPLALGLIVGAVIFSATIEDQATRPQTSSQWFRAVVVAALNSLVLAASALGILASTGA